MIGINKSKNFIVMLMLVCLVSSLPMECYSAETQQPVDLNTVEAVQKVISSTYHPYLSRPDFTKQQAVIVKLYDLSQFQPIWLNDMNTSDPAEQALRILASASDSGLNAQDYDTEALRWQWYRIVYGQNHKTLNELVLFDTALTISVLRYLSDLHFGRVTPGQAGFRFKGKVEQPDFAKIVLDAVNNRKVEKLADKVEPALVFYQSLKTALSGYRDISKQFDNVSFSFAKSLRLRDFDPQVQNLRRLLMALGDIVVQEEAPAINDEYLYSSALVAAVKRFQSRHGLDTDGIIGKQTIAALNIPISSRIHQIELALDRLRWLPVLPEKPLVLVNIPSFQLWAFDSPHSPDHEPLNMKVVVGEALDWQTPIFNADMHYLYFSPYWNVPRSIFAEEILPKMQQDALYLTSQNMELVNRFGSDVAPMAFTEQTIEQLNSGELRIRQRPGPRNALGRVKFIFPNRFGVYMHDTPAKSLFNKSRRDFSHGCIRVENPSELAEFALKNQTGWNIKKIKKAMSSKNRRVKLKTYIPVMIFYTTALAHKGQVFFLEDIYRLDGMLSKAISKRFQKPNKPFFQASS